MRQASRDRRRTISGMAPRPRKAAGTARDRVLVVRLKSSELEAFRRSADIRGISVSDLVREAVRQEISRPGRPLKNPPKPS